MKLLRRLQALFRRRKLDREMAEEMRLHLELQTERNRAAGMSAEDAHYTALRQFGGVEQIKEQCREQRGWGWLEQTWQDVKHAVRYLRKNLGFTTIAVSSLALGIGANTAVFSLIDEVLLRSLPVKDPDELVVIRWLSNSPPYEGIVGRSLNDPETGLASDTVFSLPMYQQLRDQAQPGNELFAFAPLFSLVIRSDTRTDHGRGQLVSGNYFSTLGISAWRGRMLDDADDRSDAVPVAVLGYRFWREKLGADESVVGKTITIDQLSVTVVGIMPPDFIGTLEAGQAPDVTLPLSCEPQLRRGESFMARPHIWWLHIMARLRSDVEIEQARAQLEPAFLGVIRDARRSLPKGEGNIEPHDKLRLEAGGQGLTDIRRTYQQPLSVLMSLVAFVLLLACFNLANLLIARSMERRREIAVRLSLGATRSRIVRQLLTESVLLALAGGACGILVARWGRDALLSLWDVGSSGSLVIDQRTLGFAVAASLLTGLIFGLAPAWRASRVDLNTALKSGSDGGSRSRLHASFIVTQTALATVLLIGAGLFAASLWKLRCVDAGFSRANLVLFDLDAGEAGYTEFEATQLFERLQMRFERLPGVQSSAFSNFALLTGSQSGMTVRLEAKGISAPARRPAAVNSISSQFRTTMKIPLLAGRDLDEHDERDAPSVVLVNEAFARAYFAESGVVGQRITLAGSVAFKTEDRAAEIVGVVGNTRFADLRRPIEPTVFIPYQQASLSFGGASFVLRIAESPGRLAESIAAIVREIDPSLAIANFRSQEEQVDRLLARERLFAFLAAAFGALALILTCIGLYGLLALDVAARTREIGIRMAIGAQRREVVQMVIRSGLGVTVLGCLIGLAMSAVLSKGVVEYLYQISATDLRIFAASATVLLVIGGLACWLPTRRAAKVDPMVALRCE